MVELTINSDKPEENKTISSEVGEFGVHSFVDKTFFDRKAAIKKYLGDRISDEYLNSLKLSSVKRELMKQVVVAIGYMWDNVPEGKSIERKWFAEKMVASRRIMLKAEEVICSGASDEDTKLVVSDILSYPDMLVAFTFDTLNSSIQKSFTIVAPNNKEKRYDGGEKDL